MGAPRMSGSILQTIEGELCAARSIIASVSNAPGGTACGRYARLQPSARPDQASSIALRRRMTITSASSAPISLARSTGRTTVR
jgi:hypothetical protein